MIEIDEIEKKMYIRKQLKIENLLKELEKKINNLFLFIFLQWIIIAILLIVH